MPNNISPITCKKCGGVLPTPVDHHATCPNCGKRWRLNASHTAIYSTTLKVQDVDHKQAIPGIGGRNG